MATFDGRNALEPQAGWDAERGDVSSDVNVNSSATQPIGEAENDAALKKRRMKILTRILICSVILMVASLVVLTLGLIDLYTLGDGGMSDQVRAYLILSLFAMSFSTSIWPMFMFKEGKKTYGKHKDMSRMFNCGRALAIIMSVFTLFLTVGVMVVPSISVAGANSEENKDANILYFEISVIIVCSVIGLLCMLISCPMCCCPRVFGLTTRDAGRYNTRQYFYDRARELEELKQELAARDRQEAYNRANMINDQQSGVIPSAPLLDDPELPDRGHGDERNVHDRGIYRGDGQGHGRGRGRLPPREERERQDRERDGRDRERYRDHRERDGERYRYRDGERGRDDERDGERRRGHGRGRGRSRGRGRGGRPTDRPVENKEHEDEPPSYAEVLEQMGDNEHSVDNEHIVDHENFPDNDNTTDHV